MWVLLHWACVQNSGCVSFALPLSGMDLGSARLLTVKCLREWCYMMNCIFSDCAGAVGTHSGHFEWENFRFSEAPAWWSSFACCLLLAQQMIITTVLPIFAIRCCNGVLCTNVYHTYIQNRFLPASYSILGHGDSSSDNPRIPALCWERDYPKLKEYIVW